MAVFDLATDGGFVFPGNSLTVAHAGAAGVSAVAVVVWHVNVNAAAIDSVTYGGVSCGAPAVVIDDGAYDKVYIYGLAGCPTGTQNAVVTLAGGASDYFGVGVVTVIGSDPSVCFSHVNSTSVNTNTPSVTCSSITDELAISALLAQVNTILEVGAQTNRIDTHISSWHYLLSTKPGATSSVTMGYVMGASTLSALVIATFATKRNVAAQANGGTANSPTGDYATYYPAAAVNNGDRTGDPWGSGGGWNSAAYISSPAPALMEITFNASYSIDTIKVYTIQDNYSSPVEPDDSLTHSLYGITDYSVQTWNGSSWDTRGSVSGNNLVKNTFTFAPVTTTKIRVVMTAAHSSPDYARLTEVEAIEAAASGGGSTYSDAVAEGSATAIDAVSALILKPAFPIADITAGGWLGHDPLFGGFPPLWSMLDEDVPDFTDYIFSPNNPTTQQFEVKLAPLGDPGIDTNHGIDIALEAVGLDTNFDFNLVQGTTVLDSWTEFVTLAQGQVVRRHNFSTLVASNITDYTDLRLRGVARA